MRKLDLVCLLSIINCFVKMRFIRRNGKMIPVIDCKTEGEVLKKKKRKKRTREYQDK